jgi:hypothetical protein
MRISLIHALRESAAPIQEAFARLWPGAELRNILDDSLSADLKRAGVLDERMTQRFLALGRYAIHGGTDAILFTCSAFGPCIDAVAADLAPLTVRKPTAAMVAEAVAHGGRLGLIASFEPTLASLMAEFPAGHEVVPILARGALAALARGDAREHDRLVVEAASKANVDILALAQFSLARAAPAVRAQSGKQVLTTPDAAVHELALALNRRKHP